MDERLNNTDNAQGEGVKTGGLLDKAMKINGAENQSIEKTSDISAEEKSDLPAENDATETSEISAEAKSDFPAENDEAETADVSSEEKSDLPAENNLAETADISAESKADLPAENDAAETSEISSEEKLDLSAENDAPKTSDISAEEKSDLPAENDAPETAEISSEEKSDLLAENDATETAEIYAEEKLDLPAENDVPETADISAEEKADLPAGNDAAATADISAEEKLDLPAENDAPETALSVPAENENTENLPAETPAAALAVVAENEVAELETKKGKKKKKPPKKFPKKKLPRMYKKKYSQKKLRRKLLKKLYVPADRAFVESIFVLDEATGKMIVPNDAVFEKKDLARLKRLSKEIKAQKASVKLIPLVAVAALLFMIVSAVGIFKNIVVKKALVSGMQGIFGAKTDVAKVDLRIFSASLSIFNLEQANKSSPMKNLFEINAIKIDFSLTDLLRKRVHIQNITVGGIDWNTDRKYSGALPVVPKKPNKVVDFITDKKDKVVEDVQKKLMETFDNYNPLKIAEDLKDNMQTPAVVSEIQGVVVQKIDKWKEKPDEVKVVVLDFADSVQDVINSGQDVINGVQDVINVNWGGITDVPKLKEALATVKAASEKVKVARESVMTSASKGENIKKEVESLVAAVKEDLDDVQKYAGKINDSVNADKKLVEKEVQKFADLPTTGIEGIVNDMISTIIYSLAGKYTPYVYQGIDMVNEMKAKSAAKPKKEEKKVIVRAKGRDVLYKRDVIPNFLLEKFHTSGPNFAVNVVDVSSDMDKWGRPAKLDGSLSLFGHDHTLGAVVDTRNVAEDLVDVNYSGNNWAIGVSFPEFGISTNSTISARVTADLDGSFSVGGTMAMANVQFRTKPFEPAFLYNLYTKALATLDEISVGFVFSYAGYENMALKLETDADEKFLPRLVAMLKEEMKALIEQTKERIFTEVENYTVEVRQKITDFTGIEIDVRNLRADFSGVQTKLDEAQKKFEEIQKKFEEAEKEIQKQIAIYATDAAKDLVNQYVPSQIMDSPVGDAINKTLDSEKAEGLLNKGLDALKEKFKR